MLKKTKKILTFLSQKSKIYKVNIVLWCYAPECAQKYYRGSTIGKKQSRYTHAYILYKEETREKYSAIPCNIARLHIFVAIKM